MLDTMAENQEFNRNLHGGKYSCCVHLVLFDTQRFIFTSFNFVPDLLFLSQIVEILTFLSPT